MSSKIKKAAGVVTPSRLGMVNTPGLNAGPQTSRLDAGVQTPGLDRGPQTPGLDEGVKTPSLDENPIKVTLSTESGEGREVFRQPDYLLREKPVRKERDSVSTSSKMVNEEPPLYTIPAFHIYSIKNISGVHSCLVKIGRVQGRDPTLAGNAIPNGVLPTVDGTSMITTRRTIEEAKTLYCRVVTYSNDIPYNATIVSETPTPSSTHAQPAQHNLEGAIVGSGTVAAIEGIYYYPIANFVTGASGRLKVSEQFQSGGPIIHAPGRNGHATTLHFYDCDGNNVARIVSNQGLVETNLGHQDIQSGCQDGTSSFSGSHY